MHDEFLLFLLQGARNEIFAMKPAPIQVSYMGFPGTTGASYIDYLVTDEVRYFVLPGQIIKRVHTYLLFYLTCFLISEFL